MNTFNLEEYKYLNVASPMVTKTDYREFLNLSSNELIHPITQKLLFDFQKYLKPEWISKYPYYPEYINIFADFFNITSKNILLSAGSDDAIKMLISCFAKGKKIIMQSPTYYNYKNYAILFDNEIIEVNWTKDKDSRIFLLEFQTVIYENPNSIIVLTNPSGITGDRFNIGQVREIINNCIDKNSLLIIDEAYVEFNDFNHIEFLNKYINVIIIRTLSKFPGIAGLRLGVIISNEANIEYMAKWNSCNSISTLTLEFARFCMNNKDSLNEIGADISISKNYFTKHFNRRFPTWKVYKSYSNFIMIDTYDYKTNLQFIDFLKTNHIIVKNLNNFSSFETCFRVTVGNIDTVKRFFDVIECF